MPELPEVQTVVTSLQKRVIGMTIRGADLVRPDILRTTCADFPQCLIGRRIKAISRRGKRIVFTLDDRNRFYIHLGMSGRLTLEGPEVERVKHTHFCLAVASRKSWPQIEIRFCDPRRFGGIWWLGSDESEAGTMGPEPLTLRPEQLIRRLSGTKRPIKNALMDQTVIAGLGNIYVDESLHEAGIHPLTPTDRISSAKIRQLNRAIKKVLRRALRHRGSTLRDYRDASGNAGAFQKLHRVYDRAGKPCMKCKAPIERIVVGGRSTHFCPKCQRERP
jgi:formamidopyrimidine-DNA glycosylase